MTELTKENMSKSGRVNAVCKEWLVREDGALAYQLQSQEINEHYKGNRFRNALVRQDYPTALHEQIKEKEYAERQAALYHQMINEQEEADARVARDLAKKLEKGSDVEKRRLVSEAPPLLKNELPIPPRNVKTQRPNIIQHTPPIDEPTANAQLNYAQLDLPRASTSANFTYDTVYNARSFQDTQDNNFSARKMLSLDDTPINLQSHTPEKVLAPALPRRERFDAFEENLNEGGHSSKFQPSHKHHDSLPEDEFEANCNFKKLSPAKFDYLMGNRAMVCAGASNEAFLEAQDDPIETLRDLGLPPEEIQEIDRRARQERKDEELARQLQQQLTCEMSQEERDRIVAMEAQDKELARMLQDRERAKAKRAKERAKLKKQQQEEEARGTGKPPLMEPDGDSYANPVDFIENNHGHEYPRERREYYEDQYVRNSLLNSDENYSNPVDMLMQSNDTDQVKVSINVKKQTAGAKKQDDTFGYPSGSSSANYQGPTRPSHLDIRGPINRPAAPRAHLPEGIENIATIIDPTYQHSSSSTPGSALTPPEMSEFSDHSSSPVPPYMPIQGSRRTTSLENKKKKSKDKCAHQ